jgi:hypothetical protein
VLRPAGWLIICINEWRGGFEPGLSAEARARLQRVEEIALDHEWATHAFGRASYYVSVSSMGALPDDARVALRTSLVESTREAPHRLPLTAHVYQGRRP